MKQLFVFQADNGEPAIENGVFVPLNSGDRKLTGILSGDAWARLATPEEIAAAAPAVGGYLLDGPYQEFGSTVTEFWIWVSDGNSLGKPKGYYRIVEGSNENAKLREQIAHLEAALKQVHDQQILSGTERTEFNRREAEINELRKRLNEYHVMVPRKQYNEDLNLVRSQRDGAEKRAKEFEALAARKANQAHKAFKELQVLRKTVNMIHFMTQGVSE